MSNFINSISKGTLREEKLKIMDKKIVGKTFDIFDSFKEEGYEYREGQVDMALDVAETIKDYDNLIIEGGVGIGKSFAYLIPALYTFKFNRKPIIIATSTIQLSEQLKEDIKQAKNITGVYEPKVVIAKGKNNFACKRKAEKIEAIDQELLDWVIDDGDQANLKLDITNSMWKKLQVDHTCVYKKCNFSKKCSYLRMRRNINNEGRADIIIANQDLLIAHLAKKNSQGYTILNDASSMIIIDEAHNLEDKARNILKKDWTLSSVKNTLKQTFVGIHNKTDEIYNKIDFLENEINKYFSSLYNHIFYLKNNDENLKEANKFPIDDNYDSNKIRRVKDYINDISITFQLNNSLSDYEQDKIIEELSSLKNLFNILTSKEEFNQLIWLELNNDRVIISSAPKKINEQLKKLLFSEEKSIILTSATLTQSNSYNYQIEKLGFPKKDIFISPPKESPFPYEENVINYMPTSIANPNNKNKYIEDIANEIIKLSNLTQGRTLALFTAKEHINMAYNKLKNKNLNYKVLKQSEHSSQSETMEEFINSNGLLLATGIFWEGIDIRGNDLTSLIITKLPFPVPDPIIEYKTSQAKNKFDILVPEMIIKLKQGMGRLIRSNTDKGIISILDSRVNKESKSLYRKDVIDALLSRNITNSFKDVKSFAKDKFEYL